MRYNELLATLQNLKPNETFTIRPEHLINRTLRLPQVNNKCK